MCRACLCHAALEHAEGKALRAAGEADSEVVAGAGEVRGLELAIDYGVQLGDGKMFAHDVALTVEL